MEPATPDLPHARGARIRQIRTQYLRMTRKALCQHTDISTATLRSWEMGFSSGLSEKGARKLVMRFQELNLLCSSAWLLHGIGNPPHLATEAVQYDPLEDNQIATEILLFKQAYPDALVFKAEDESMAPALWPEGYALGLPAKKNSTVVDKINIVIFTDGTRCLRIVRQNTSSDKYILQALDANFTDIASEKIQTFAPVFWMRNRRTGEGFSKIAQ